MRLAVSVTILICHVLLLAACAGPYAVGTRNESGTMPDQTRIGANEAGRGNASPYTVFGKSYSVMPDSHGYLEIGIASWYGKKFHGRLTSMGEVYDMHGLTAAHKALPLPTYVKVTNLDNRRHAIVKVNDRGPFHDDRLIDLSYEAAMQLGFADKGTAPVVVEALDNMNGIDVTGSDSELAAGASNYYLQVGAFANRQSAETLMSRIKRLISVNEMAPVSVKILESEQKSSVLHKVWMGPLSTLMERDTLAMMVENANLGRPLKVEIE